MDLGSVLEDVERIFKITAIIAGGIWAYYHYFRGRMYKPRLELGLSGRLISSGRDKYLLTHAQLKNLGLSKVRLEQRGSGLRVTSIEEYREGRDPKKALREKRLKTFPVFEHHKWIESGEPISDQRLLPIPILQGEIIALRLELRVVARKISWRAIRIIECS